MQQDSQTPDVLYDLAVVYLGLADADDEVSNTEIEHMAARLRRWQEASEGTLTVLGAIKHAMEDYATAEDVSALQRESLRRLHAALSRDRKDAILEDLTDISMADDRMLAEESRYLGEITQIWNLAGDPEAEDA